MKVQIKQQTFKTRNDGKKLFSFENCYNFAALSLKFNSPLCHAMFSRHFNFFDIVRLDDEKELSKRYGMVSI